MAARKHPLAHLVPDPKFGPLVVDDDGNESGTYISRRIDGVSDMRLLRYAHETNQPVMMFGDTGPGKTSMVLAYCAQAKIPLVTIMGNGGIDPNVFWVVPLPDPDAGFKLVETDVLTAVREGNCCIYIDEINFVPPKVLSPLNSLLDVRRQVTVMELGNELVHAGDNLLIVATYNPEYEGTRPLNQALKNRFPVMLAIDYDEAVERELLYMPVMMELAGKLRAARPATIRTPTSTNMLVDFEQIAIDVSLDFAITNFCNHFDPTERQAVGLIFEQFRQTLELQVQRMEGD